MSRGERAAVRGEVARAEAPTSPTRQGTVTPAPAVPPLPRNGGYVVVRGRMRSIPSSEQREERGREGAIECQETGWHGCAVLMAEPANASRPAKVFASSYFVQERKRCVLSLAIQLVTSKPAQEGGKQAYSRPADDQVRRARREKKQKTKGGKDGVKKKEWGPKLAR